MKIDWLNRKVTYHFVKFAIFIELLINKCESMSAWKAMVCFFSSENQLIARSCVSLLRAKSFFFIYTLIESGLSLFFCIGLHLLINNLLNIANFTKFECRVFMLHFSFNDSCLDISQHVESEI